MCGAKFNTERPGKGHFYQGWLALELWVSSQLLQNPEDYLEIPGTQGVKHCDLLLVFIPFKAGDQSSRVVRGNLPFPSTTLSCGGWLGV